MINTKNTNVINISPNFKYFALLLKTKYNPTDLEVDRAIDKFLNKAPSMPQAKNWIKDQRS